ncbi:MAG: ATP-binding protein [Chloroflexi bacterium]|nr:ATP-binding protein [Chloroflexota bacterium]
MSGYYTEAPPLQRNLLLGSWQILFWLFFHPAGWRNHVARIAPDLPADFALLQLGRRYWGNRAIWRLLVLAFLSWPILVALLVVGILSFFNLPSENVIFGVALGVAAGVLLGTMASLTGSVAIGVAVGLAVGVVVGVGGSFVLSNVILLPLALPSDDALGMVLGLAGGVAGGLSFAVATGVAVEMPDRGRNLTYSLIRQVSGVIVGTFVGLASGWLTSRLSGSIFVGVIIGLPFGLAVGWRTESWKKGLFAGLILAVVAGLGGLLALLMPFGVGGGLVLVTLAASLFALPYVLAERLSGPWAGALAGSLGSGAGFFFFVTGVGRFWPALLLTLVGLFLGLTLAWWRPIVLYPVLAVWHRLLWQLDQLRPRSPHFFRWHSAFWDEFQRLPLTNLDEHLLLVITRNPDEGQKALEYLLAGHQRWAAQAVEVELEARQLERCTTAQAIAQAHRRLGVGDLAGPASTHLRSMNRLSRDVAAALQQESSYNQRLALSAVEDRLDGHVRELTRSSEPYADRFRTISAHWRQILADYILTLTQTAELRQEIDNPYVIGVPLTDQQEIFVGRTDISSHIEQLLLDRRRPPLLLYGQRRMGKTSLLNNLGRLLPSTIVPLFVDLQGPATRASDHTGFLYNMARGITDSANRQRGLVLAPLTREALADDPFTRFDEWLDGVEEALGQRMALLALDEFEALHEAFRKGRFAHETILGMFRHLIQHRPRFKVLLAGSHTLEAFHEWASYLINVQVVRIGYLQEAETLQLIERPVQDYALRYDAAASQRVLTLTKGHPFLVQLLCAEVVTLKNEQAPMLRRLARVEDVNAAAPQALAHGSFFFADIERNQVNEAGLRFLRWLAQYGEGTGAAAVLIDQWWQKEKASDTHTLSETLEPLRQRELIEQNSTGYRFQVPLIQQYFAQLYKK